MFKCAIYTNKNSPVSAEKQRLACQDFAVKRGWTVLKKDMMILVIKACQR
ncbi:MAG: hypothetical protein PG981_001436 [Wolbachia endosymbiont of Ctenocephalides orientis wCori]|nr:MAG: hypothetical protein PG981_001436 [Wolbachia endosymbiont of Ctenocephalides orientis wCori]